MKLHVEVGADPAVAQGSVRPELLHQVEQRFARELAVGLAARGHSVSLRGGAGSVPGVERLAPNQNPPAVDVLIGFGQGRHWDVVARRRVAVALSGAAPGGNWNIGVALTHSRAAIMRRRGMFGHVLVVPPGCTPLPRPTGRRDRFLVTSPPALGLRDLLAHWPTLWAAFGLPLSIACDLRAALASPHAPGEVQRSLPALLDQPGLVVHEGLDEEQLARLHARSLALLLPAAPEKAAAEALLLSVLEAAAAGCPAIVATTDGLPPDMYAAVKALPVSGGAARSWERAIEELIEEHDKWLSKTSDLAGACAWDRRIEGWEQALERALATDGAVHEISGKPDEGEWLVVGFGADAWQWSWLAGLLAVAATRHRVRLLVPAAVQGLPPDLASLQVTDAAQITALLHANPARILLVRPECCRDLLERLPDIAPRVPVVTVLPSEPWALHHVEGQRNLHLLLCAADWTLLRRELELSLPSSRALRALLPRVRCTGPLDPFMANGSVPGVCATRMTLIVALRDLVGFSSDEVEVLLEGASNVADHCGMALQIWGEMPVLRLPANATTQPWPGAGEVGSALGAAAAVIGGGQPEVVDACASLGIPFLAVLPARAGSARLSAAQQEGRVTLMEGVEAAAVVATVVRSLFDQARPAPRRGGAELAVRLLEQVELVPECAWWAEELMP